MVLRENLQTLNVVPPAVHFSLDALLCTVTVEEHRLRCEALLSRSFHATELASVVELLNTWNSTTAWVTLYFTVEQQNILRIYAQAAFETGSGLSHNQLGYMVTSQLEAMLQADEFLASSSVPAFEQEA